MSRTNKDKNKIIKKQGKEKMMKKKGKKRSKQEKEKKKKAYGISCNFVKWREKKLFIFDRRDSNDYLRFYLWSKII